MEETLSREMPAMRTFSGAAASAAVRRTSRVSSSESRVGAADGARTMRPAAGVLRVAGDVGGELARVEAAVGVEGGGERDVQAFEEHAR